jgi:hypothetical protein
VPEQAASGDQNVQYKNEAQWRLMRYFGFT